MKRGQGADGFTIIETLIVLAVTGVLFLIAVITVGGKQNETEFQQAINDAQSNIRRIINDVNSGDYQTATNLDCAVSGGGLTISQDSGGNNTEGTNAGCEFLGKVVQFGLNSNNNELVIYPVAGLQCLNRMINGVACDGTIAQVQPTLVAPSGGGSGQPPDTSSTAALEYGLSVDHVNFVSGGSTTPIGAVGFISGVGNYSGGQLASGTQQIALVPITNTSVNTGTGSNDSWKAVKDIEGSPSPSNLISSYDAVAGSTAAYSVQICLASGTTNQSGLVTIGVTGDGSLNAVSTSIFSNKTCT